MYKESSFFRTMSIKPFSELEGLIRLSRLRDLSLDHGLLPEHAERVFRRGADIGSRIYWCEGPERLMPRAREEIIRAEAEKRSIPSGTVWMTDRIEGAKGRRERVWWAPPGGIYACLAISPFLLEENWSFYSLGLGVAIAQVLREWGVPATVRWINDVLVSGKKVAGVLTEAIRLKDCSYLLFGIGINVNIKAFPDHLPEATSILLETGRECPIPALAADVLARIGWIFGLLHEWEARVMDEDDPDMENPALSAWTLASDTLGRDVAYGMDAERSPEIIARAVALSRDGGLVLETKSGERFTVRSGEIRYCSF
ncbi:MAG: biotin--[acetyl-CoA-carboxylase] ligase [Deltaproteobacteria bacterium]